MWATPRCIQMKKNKQSRNAHSISRDARRFQESIHVLNSLGIRDLLKNTSLFKRMTTVRYPHIEVDAIDKLPADEVEAILRDSRREIRAAEFDFPLLGKICIDTYFRVVKPILDILSTATATNPKLQLAIEECRKKTAKLASLETASEAVLALSFALDGAAARFGRIDSRLFYWEIESGRRDDGKWALRFILRSTLAEKKIFRLPGGDRIAYRCGQPYSWQGIHWVRWNSSVFGMQTSNVTLPVYVQSHALDKLYKREARALFIEGGEWLVHDYLWDSLRKMRIHPIPAQPKKVLVEYWLCAHKIGYLVAQLVDDAVLIETFLFLTMDGTPEGDLLKAKLKLRRSDKQQLELDRIGTFLLSDIQSDSELVELLSECGCGHLFRIWKDPIYRKELLKGYAEDMRKYLCIAPNQPVIRG